MDRNNFIFALLVLGAVLFGSIRNESAEELVLEQKPETTSFAAILRIAPPSEIITGSLPRITAASALARDLSASEPFYLLNNGQQWPIASLTKLMTAIVAREKFPANAKIKVSANAVATEGGAGGFFVGGVYNLSQLLKPLLKLSSNDAAVALAEFYGEEKFLEEMNKKAATLGMRNTRFFDSSGLSPLNQSTLEDLEKLAVYIFHRHPDIFDITAEREGNIHPFAGKENFLGGKTGFIDEANGNLISLFSKSDGGTLLVIVLGSEDRFLDTKILYDRFASN